MAVSHTIQMLGLIGAASYLAARLARGSGRAAFHRYAIVAQPRAALPPMPRGFIVRALVTDLLTGPHAYYAPPTPLLEATSERPSTKTSSAARSSWRYSSFELRR